MPPQTPSQPSAEERLTALEELFTHLQQTTQTLNEVLIEQGRRLAQLEREVNHFGDQLRTSLLAEPTERKPEDEKPPHY